MIFNGFNFFRFFKNFRNFFGALPVYKIWLELARISLICLLEAIFGLPERFPIEFQWIDFFDVANMSEFFSGTSGFWIPVKIGNFTSGRVPSTHKKFGVNRPSNGRDLG